MNWNYRLMRVITETEETYSIHEVYYDGDKISSWTESPSFPLGESLEEFVIDFGHYKAAIDKPIITVTRKGDEYEISGD